MAKKSKKSPERMELARHLVKEFDLKTAADAQNLLKEIFGPMLQSMLEGEMDDHLGYDKYERTEEVKPNSRNGHSGDGHDILWRFHNRDSKRPQRRVRGTGGEELPERCLRH